MTIGIPPNSSPPSRPVPSDERLRQLLSGSIEDADELAEALALMRAHPALAEARAEISRRADLAKAHLAPLPEGEAKNALLALCDQVVQRSA